MCNCDDLKVGDNVFYTDNGPTDTGVVQEITDDASDFLYEIDWDNGEKNDGGFMRSQLTKV